MRAAIRSALLLLFRRIARIYFREVEVAGDLPRSDTRGRLFAANHVNGLVDPVLVLTQAPCRISPVAKSTLWSIPGLRFLLDVAEAVPIVRRRDVPEKSAADNEAVFVRVAAHLAGGGNILIFPEGTSHNEPHLLELRSGAGRMLARASAEPLGDELTFQSIALEFDARDLFRSRALVLFGPVRRVRDLPPGEPDVAKAVTSILRDDLSELLVEGSTWEERILLVRVAEMFAADARDHSLEHVNRVGRRIEHARRMLASAAPEDVAAIEDRLRAYLRAVEDQGATDRDVVRLARGGAAGAAAPPARVARAAAMVATLPLALAAVPLYWLPYQLPRFVARRLKGDPDVTSTYKLGVGLVIYPVWAALLVTLAFAKLPTEEAALASVLALAAPFAALAWLDRWDRLAAKAAMLSPSEVRVDRLRRLAEERRTLMDELERLRARVEDAAQDSPPRERTSRT